VRSPAEELGTPRVAILPVTREDVQNERDPLLGDDTFELTTNERITANDWYQEVRHLVFRCGDDLDFELSRKLNGIGAAMTQAMLPWSIRKRLPDVLDSFLTTMGSSMGWSNVADDPIRMQHVFEGWFTSVNGAISTR